MELNELFDLIDKFESSSLTEFRYEHAEEKVVLKRESEQQESSLPYYTQPVMVQPHAAVQPAAATVPAAGGATPEAGGGERGGAESAKGVEQITSPIVGTFYRSASPDSPPFVHEGDVVESGQTLCILEAMKVMNELEAEFNMEIVAILAKNGDMVDFGTPLFEVRRV